MQTTNQKEGIDIVEGEKIIALFDGMIPFENPYREITFEDGIYRRFNIKEGTTSIVGDLKYHLDFEWLIPAVRRFNELDPIPVFPQWVTWCEQINNTLIETYEPLPVFYVLVEAVRDYNLHTKK